MATNMEKQISGVKNIPQITTLERTVSKLTHLMYFFAQVEYNINHSKTYRSSLHLASSETDTFSVTKY